MPVRRRASVSSTSNRTTYTENLGSMKGRGGRRRTDRAASTSACVVTASSGARTLRLLPFVGMRSAIQSGTCNQRVPLPHPEFVLKAQGIETQAQVSAGGRVASQPQPDQLGWASGFISSVDFVAHC